MAQQNRKTDFIETPEIGSFRYLDQKPAKEERIERDQQNGMGEVSMILDGKLVIEEAEDKVGVWEKPYRQSCESSPLSDFLIMDSPGNNGSG